MTTMQPVSLSGLSETHHAKPRKILTIAADVRRHWPEPYYGAVPYLEAMESLEFVTESFGHDSAQSIITYFLSNATRWKGDDARRIKAELKAMLK